MVMMIIIGSFIAGASIVGILLLFGFLLPLLFLGKQRGHSRTHMSGAIGRGTLLSIFVLAMMGLALKDAASVLAVDPAGVRGKAIFAKMACANCHRIQGEGAQVGPDLSYVGDKRDRKWLLAHFKDPQSVSPNSIMPPVSLPDAELADLSAYMLSLKKEVK